jgi:hypothetical protein
MNNLDAVIQDLVIANRILVKQEVVDAYGHVSVRHPNDPNRFLIVRPLAPELLRPEDIVELDLDGRRCGEDHNLYLERFVHAAILAERPSSMPMPKTRCPSASSKEQSCGRSRFREASLAPRYRSGISPRSSATPICW